MSGLGRSRNYYQRTLALSLQLDQVLNGQAQAELLDELGQLFIRVSRRDFQQIADVELFSVACDFLNCNPTKMQAVGEALCSDGVNEESLDFIKCLSYALHDEAAMTLGQLRSIR